jgi:hypothetical protein
LSKWRRKSGLDRYRWNDQTGPLSFRDKHVFEHHRTLSSIVGLPRSNTPKSNQSSSLPLYIREVSSTLDL